MEHRTFETTEVLQQCETCQCECGMHVTPDGGMPHKLNDCTRCPRCGAPTDLSIKGDVHG